MASFSSSSSFFSNNPSSFEVDVTRDELYAFHTIDRNLFTRLVFVLNRDMNQSSQVIAFLYLVEHVGFVREIIASLVTLQDKVIDAVANEVAVCLSFLYNQDYSSFFLANNNDDELVIPLLLKMTGGKLTIRYIHQNRDTFLVGVKKTLTDVCDRAFDDLYVKAETYNKEKQLALERERVIEEMKKIRLGVQQQTNNWMSVQQPTPSWLSVQQPPSWMSVQQQNPSWSNVQQGNLSRWKVQQGNPSRLKVQQGNPSRSNVQQGNSSRSSVQQGTAIRFMSIPQERAPAPSVEEEEANNTATEIVGADTNENEEAVIPADDRTVFLTFSKGYPISESEIRAYFTRKFGDVIEAIVMQDVEGNDQSLYARMVLKMQCAWKMEDIASARKKNKYTIEGKHVWARKYVPKTHGFSASSSSAHV